ncbi:MAG TPA: hypothetical protein VIY48_11495 [Candidatus Paceibacterota bacterium]
MIGASYGNVEDIEVLWTIIAFVGLVYSFLNIKEAYRDWKFVQSRRITNGRRVLARTHLLSEIVRAGILMIFLAIGVLAFTVPTVPDNHIPHNVIIITAVTRWGLIVSSIGLVYKTYLAKHARDEIQVGGHTELTTRSENEEHYED